MNTSIRCNCCNNQMNLFDKSHGFLFYHCSACGFWTTKTESDTPPLHIYDNEPAFVGEDGDRKQLVNEAKHILSHKFKMIRNHVDNGIFPNQGRMLDIGCSEGLYVEAATLLGWESLGFEVDGAKIERARAFGLNISEPDYTSVTPESLDFIMSRHVLEHIPGFIDIIESALCLLKPGGVLCVETPNMNCLSKVIYGEKIRETSWGAPGLVHLYPPTHVHGFTKKSWIAVSRQFNLLPVYIKTYAPPDGNWNISSAYHKKGLVPLAHRLSAKVGLGEGIAAFFLKR